MRRELAILNNVTWCAAVVGAHGLGSGLGEHYWAAEGAVPLYYSNLVTRTAEEGTEAQLTRIRALAAEPPKPVWSLKDSCATLDPQVLQGLGLGVLFEAHWFGVPARGDAVDAGETGIRFSAVDSRDELARWEAAWQLSSPARGVTIFPPALLDDPDVTFLVGLRGTDPVAGAVANLSEGVVGLSNVHTFAPDLSAGFHRDCVRALGELHPDRAIVGYGRAADLDVLAPLGVVDLGPLRVWISGREDG